MFLTVVIMIEMTRIDKLSTHQRQMDALIRDGTQRGFQNSKRECNDVLKYGKNMEANMAKNPRPRGAFGGRFLAIFASIFYLAIFLVIVGSFSKIWKEIWSKYAAIFS